ncbi:MAG: bifunctional diguanylate cyclase/phosphodiesterase [Proteobacteria bacterium]|nr:bifunctional diguanylate cyclase/phosphodiesterase [Pseudomonadota bacterium]
MSECVGKNILICSNLKTERVLFFTYFDEKESKMIYSEKDIKGCTKLMASEQIDCLVIDCSDNLIQNPGQLDKLIKPYKTLKIILLIQKNTQLSDSCYQQFSQSADKIFFEPISMLEVETKLPDLFLTDNKPTKAYTTTTKIETIGVNDELWGVLFKDSAQAKLIVSATDQKILYANEQLLTLFNLSAKNVLGSAWTLLDNVDNHKNYPAYIKEINIHEKSKFNIKTTQNNTVSNLVAEYQLAVLNGDMVFIGQIVPEALGAISQDFYNHFLQASSVDIYSKHFQRELNELKNSLGLEFIIFTEFREKKFLQPITTGCVDCIEDIMTNHFSSLVSKVKEKGIIEIAKNNAQVNDISDIFNKRDLQDLYVYQIYHQNTVYGLVIAGNKNKNTELKSNSLLLQTLVLQCKFNLFQKKIMSQRAVEGQVDKLTGLPNRSSMTSNIAMFIEQGVSSDKYLSIMIIAIEKLSYLNKKLGIELTDEIIVGASKIIGQMIGSKGLVYRVSGNEFIVLLHPHLDKQLIQSEVKLLISKLSNPILLSNGEEINITFNIGISIFPDAGQTISSMIKNAELAMFDAKLAGQNNYIIFKYSETGQALKHRARLEENLKQAIDTGHIKIVYQPKIDALTEDIVGFEALARWTDSELGVVTPRQFISLAEETKLINPLGEFIVKQACKKLVEWQKQYGLSLSCSINLSVVQLMDENLPKILEKIINNSGIHPHYIDFEITETINLDIVPNLVDLLKEIAEIGCTLSIDDFGTGHSSLDYVKRIPAKFIKIDQSFVKNIGLDPEDEAILDATIDIAKRLNRKIIAEGVETEEQREYLLDREVEYFQGFLFATPMAEDKIEELLEQRIRLMGVN